MSKKRKRRNKGANRSQAPQARPAAETGAVRPVATRAAAYEPRPRTAAEEREGAPVYSRAKEAACAMRDQRRAGDAPEAPDAPAPEAEHIEAEATEDAPAAKREVPKARPYPGASDDAGKVKDAAKSVFRAGAVCAAVGLLSLAVGLMAVLWAVDEKGAVEAPAEQAPAAAEAQGSPAAAAHSHVWRQVEGELAEHAAVTHEEEVPAVTEEVTVERTLCNVCGEAIDGKTASHAKETGHVGYTVGVPVTETVTVSEARTETVIDEPAWTEAAVKLVCEGCGEVAEPAAG